MSLTRIAYRNDSGSTVPPHGFIQFSGTPITTATGDYVISAVKHGDGVGPVFIDDGKGATSSGDGSYGSCFAACEGVVWVSCSATLTAWDEIGPIDDSFEASKYGNGFIYCGITDATNDRVLTLRNTQPWYWAKLASSMTAGTFESPTTTTVNVWLPNTASGSTPKPFIVTAISTLLGMTVSNRTEAVGSTGLSVRITHAFGEWTIVGANCP